MTISEKNGVITVDGFGKIALAHTLDCGQAFRWREISPGVFSAVVRGVYAEVRLEGDALVFERVSARDVENVFVPYFDLGYDYAAATSRLCEDDYVRVSFEKYGTLRILRQEPWEALCSFIISQCNNISRIKGIIDRLCSGFGDTVGDSFSFPSAERLASLDAGDLDPIRSGYRAPYIIAAARAVAGGEIDLDALASSDADSARKTLMSIPGVGRKVADCALLFGLGFRDVFPVDRHISRRVAELYPEGLPECFMGNSGLAQQYLFLSSI